MEVCFEGLEAYQVGPLCCKQAPFGSCILIVRILFALDLQPECLFGLSSFVLPGFGHNVSVSHAAAKLWHFTTQRLWRYCRGFHNYDS